MNRKPHRAVPFAVHPLSFLWIVSALTITAVVACGSSGPGEGGDIFEPPPVPSSPISHVQEQWTEVDFDEFALGEPEITSLQKTLATQGFTNYVTSGRIEDEDGARLEFGAYANASGDQKAVVRHCQSGDCIRAIASLSSNSMTWSDASGGSVAVRPVAIPYLLRQTLKQDPSQGSHLVTALTDADPVDPSLIDLNRRRLILANQFGDAFGFTGDSSAGTLSASPLFTEVMVDDYVTRPSLESYLTSSYPHEVLVLVSQSLRQLYRDSEDPNDRWYRTLGIEVQSGLYGFEWVSAQSLGQALKQAPLSGPGVVLWLGGESLGDMTQGMTDNPESMYTHVGYPGKVVAGFIHHDRPERLIEAAAEFLERLGAGQTSGEARDGANALLQAWESNARLAFAEGSDEEFRLPRARSDFWEDRVPSTGIINPYLILRPWCKPEGGKEYALDEREGNPWIGDLILDGPVFRGSRDHEVDHQTTLHMEILGVLGEIREGAHLYFVFEGGLKKEFPDVTLYANAEITEVVDSPDSLTIRFKGTGESLTFTNELSESCTFKYMLLEPLIGGTGKYSELTLEY